MGALTAVFYAWTRHLAYGVEPIISESQVEGDGRKVGKALANLIKDGYLTEKLSPHVKGRSRYFATPKAFDEVQEEDPGIKAMTYKALGEKKHEHEAKQFCGLPVFPVAFTVRPNGQVKYILTHKDEYEFVFANNYGATWDDPERCVPYVLGTKRVDDVLGPYELKVRPKGFALIMAETIHKLKFDRLYKTNLAWGLQQQGLIEPVDADVFTAENNSLRLFGGAASTGFGDEPKEWGRDSTRSVQTLRARIAEDTRRANVLLTTEQKILNAGGWDKVLAKYAGDLDKALREEEAKPEAEQEEVAHPADLQ